jgi:hypothetical protein
MVISYSTENLEFVCDWCRTISLQWCVLCNGVCFVITHVKVVLEFLLGVLELLLVVSTEDHKRTMVTSLT